MESIKCSTGYRPELRTLKFQFCLPFGLISDILQRLIWGVSPMLSPFPLLPLLPLPSPPQKNYLSYSPRCSLNISYGTDEKNLFDNQERPTLVIISFILMTCTFDLKVILYGEIRSQTLVGVNGWKLFGDSRSVPRSFTRLSTFYVGVAFTCMRSPMFKRNTQDITSIVVFALNSSSVTIALPKQGDFYPKVHRP